MTEDRSISFHMSKTITRLDEMDAFFERFKKFVRTAPEMGFTLENLQIDVMIDGSTKETRVSETKRE